MKKFIAGFMALSIIFSSICVYGGESKIPAFPGAEGGGKYVSGGRGGEVYVVTTLEDYDPDTEEAIKGSFRDAVSKDNRIVVFNVGGVIKLKRNFSLPKNIAILRLLPNRARQLHTSMYAPTKKATL